MPAPTPRPAAESRRSPLTIALVVVAGVMVVGALAVVGVVAWVLVSPVEFDQRAEQVVAPGEGAGTATVEIGPHLAPDEADTLDEQTEMPLAVCHQQALARLAAGDGDDVDLIAAGTHQPDEDRRVTVQLTGGEPQRGTWKLQASWDGRTHSDDLDGVTVTVDPDGDALVRTSGGEQLAELRCHQPPHN